MANSFTSINIHFVFSTKNRKNLIDDKMQSRLWEYIGGIAKQHNMVALAIGGTNNHVHMLVSMPAALSPAKSIQLIKSNSSKWVNEEFPNKNGFSWQVGYSGFSVSPRQIQNVINYITGQEEHHRIRSFEEEYISFLKDSVIEYDERYVWG
ncbi:MAG: IS200/IS605 family transposase [Bacteroidales bacterium]|nr:IS200/IS605 family transposase [Bacteroidales bacterium]